MPGLSWIQGPLVYDHRDHVCEAQGPWTCSTFELFGNFLSWLLLPGRGRCRALPQAQRGDHCHPAYTQNTIREAATVCQQLQLLPTTHGFPGFTIRWGPGWTVYILLKCELKCNPQHEEIRGGDEAVSD